MRRIAPLLGLFALVAACQSSSDEPDESFVTTLDLDIRDSASVRVERRGEALDVSIELSKGFGVAPEGERLSGKGRLERFPEAEMTLYTARFAVAAQPGGPCGKEPISLALSLSRRGVAPRLSGSLTPYCGEGVWHGTPSRSPLRLSTPPVEE